MKKIYLFVCCALLLTIGKAQFPAPYCAEAYASNVEPITSVVFATISNTSPETVGGSDHEDFTSINADLTIGGSYSMSVQGNTDGSFTDYIRVFIDWNQNGDFTDAGESFNIGTITSSTGLDGKTATANIIVPASAMLGATRMRVTKKWNAYQTPCNTAGYGESEDYTVTILASALCSGTPVAGTASAPNQACSNNSFTLSLTGATIATGIHYQWQKTTIGGSSWTNLLNDTNMIALVTQGVAGADFRCVVTCTATSQSVNSNVVSVALQTTNCPPPNDNICSAITLLLDSAADCQTTTNASSVDDPTGFTCSAPNNTTWYKYTPVNSGLVEFKFTAPATGDILNGWLGVYTVSGSCPGALTFTDVTNTVLTGCKSFGASASSTTFFTGDLVGGTEYYFMIDGVSGDVGQYCISIQTPPTAPATCATNSLPANNATNVTGSPAVTLKWSSVAGATSYDLYHGTANPPTTLIGTVSADSALVTGTGYNTTYYWYVVPKNSGGSASGCDANLTSYTTGGVPASASNDDPCDADTLVLDGTSSCKNTAFATSVGDPTSFTCSAPNNTLWYKYTPVNSGNVQFTFTPPASGDTLYGWLGIYTASGTCPGTLTFTDVTNSTLGSCKAFGAVGAASTIFSANLTGGTEYYFMIDGVSGDVGQYCISIQTPPPAPATCATNSLPANSATSVSAPITTLKWGAVTGATSYDVYLGTANPPTTLIGNTVNDSLIATGLAYNTDYFWYVVPKNGGGSASGCDANTTTFTTVAPPPPPTNDECDSAFTISGTPLNATTMSATQSQAAELCAGFTGNANDDVWFTFTATQNGGATITTVPATGSSFDGVIIVYSGSCGSLTSIGCADATFGGGTEVATVTGLVAGNTYYARVYGYGGVGSEGTFTISATGTALPVSMSKFVGERKGSTNLLSWTSATEVNNKGFEVQRSAIGDNFLPMTFVESKASNGNSSSAINYQATDSKPYAGTTYYRLKQVDKNGKTSYSNVVAIKGERINNLVISDVYPNPANRDLNLVIASPTNESVNIIVTDITGKILKKQASQIVSGNNNLKLDVSNLASGSYLIKMVCSNGCTTNTTKFIKQ